MTDLPEELTSAARGVVRLSILIVTHNAVADIGACLSSIEQNPPSVAYEVIVADNASGDGTAQVARAHSGVTVVETGGNLGFASGNHAAAAVATGDLLLLLNPDTIIGNGALDALILALADEDRIWVAGACLIGPDGGPATTWGDFPTVGWAIANTAPWNRLGLSVRSRSRMGATCEGIDEIRSVGWVSGAAFLIRRSAWDRLGGLHTGYFMYFEETDLCFRVHEGGGDVVLVPDARIVHLEGGAVGQASTRQRVWFTEGMIRFFTRNGSPLSGPTVRAWVFLVNALLWVASWPVGIVWDHARRERKRYGALVRTALGQRVIFDTDGVPR